MRTATFTLSTPDGDMEIYEAAPDGDAVGAVIVIQEAFGVNEHMRDVTRRFADAGYRAVAPTLFHRAGGGTAEYGDMDAVMKLFPGVSDDGFLMDVDACLAHLAGEGYEPEHVERLRSALDESTPVDHDIIRYPDAKHGFHCDARPDAFNAEAAADGWTRAVDWLYEHLNPVEA